MFEYSFLDESNKATAVNKILSTAAAATLGSSIGKTAGGYLGKGVSKISNRKINSSNINWTDPVLMRIIQNDLLDAKNNVKLAREWLNSCDLRDKERAKLDLKRAIDEYRRMQRDISYRKADRWLEKYKQELSNIRSKKYSTLGKNIGMGIGGITTAGALLRQR